MRSSFVCVFVGLCLTLAGCMVSQKYLVEKTARELGLARSDCTAILTVPNNGTGSFAWEATCKDRIYHCHQRCFGTAGCNVHCSETGRSKGKVSRKVVIDRLSLETGCPPEKIKVIRKASWISGSERAYRMEACGSVYVCTAADGRTACKAALSRTAPAKALSEPTEPERLQAEQAAKEHKACLDACKDNCEPGDVGTACDNRCKYSCE